MQGQVTQIFRGKRSYNYGQQFYRIYTFRLDNGKSAKAYVVEGFHNFTRWSSVERGDVLIGLVEITSGKINADSEFRVIKKPVMQTLWQNSVM